MNYPALEDIFLQFNFNSEKSPEIKELHRVANRYLDRLAAAKKLSKSEVNCLKDQKAELETEAKTLGFKQGFRLAVKLFIEN